MPVMERYTTANTLPLRSDTQRIRSSSVANRLDSLSTGGFTGFAFGIFFLGRLLLYAIHRTPAMERYTTANTLPLRSDTQRIRSASVAHRLDSLSTGGFTGFAFGILFPGRLFASSNSTVFSLYDLSPSYMLLLISFLLRRFSPTSVHV